MKKKDVVAMTATMKKRKKTRMKRKRMGCLLLLLLRRLLLLLLLLPLRFVGCGGGYDGDGGDPTEDLRDCGITTSVENVVVDVVGGEQSPPCCWYCFCLC